MQLSRNMRLMLALSVVLTLLGIAAAAVGLAGSLAEIWQRLRDGPAPVFYGLLLFLLAITLLGGWLIWRLLFPARPKIRKKPHPTAPTREVLERRIADGRSAGIDVAAAERELRELARRSEAGQLVLCFFGQISTGKSSLINALVPEAEVATGVVGGTTTDIDHYRWLTRGGDELLIADVPGTAAPGSEAETAALAEAVRAHVVIYTCDSDLSREQYEELATLVALAKPLVLALNKSDRYSAAELEQLRGRLQQRLRQAGAEDDAAVVVVSSRAGGDGVRGLADAIQNQIERSPDALDALRDAAVFTVVAGSLDTAEAQRRRQRAAELVRGYTRKAVVGAVAAVSPGTDILIQGYLGTALVKEMCAIYDVPAKEIDIDRLLKLGQGYVGRTLPIMLAVAGNALKAFPGVGTIAGGMTHAVAYGLIFDALGRGLTQALEESGELRPAAAARKFRENLGEDLRSRTIRMAKLVLEAKGPASRD